MNEDLKSFVCSDEGALVTGLVREFLQHFNLDFTLSVWDSESQCGTNWMYPGRASLANHFNVDPKGKYLHSGLYILHSHE